MFDITFLEGQSREKTEMTVTTTQSIHSTTFGIDGELQVYKSINSFFQLATTVRRISKKTNQETIKTNQETQ